MPTIHHLGCGTFCPIALKRGGDPPMVCHVLLIETADRLVLVDTGFGTADIDDVQRLPRAFRALTKPALRHEETALAQLKRLGFARHEVTDIVVTHLDLDHAGGLSDFPDATVHVHAAERDAAIHRADLFDKARYVPAQFAHGPKWQAYADAGDQWMGLPAVAELRGIPGIGLVPLIGHSRGHSAVVIEVGNRSLVHAGDAYFHRDELTAASLAPLGLRAFQRTAAWNDALRRESADRLRELHRSEPDSIDIFSAHDPIELVRMQGTGTNRATARPAR